MCVLLARVQVPLVEHEAGLCRCGTCGRNELLPRPLQDYKLQRNKRFRRRLAEVQRCASDDFLGSLLVCGQRAQSSPVT